MAFRAGFFAFVAGDKCPVSGKQHHAAARDVGKTCQVLAGKPGRKQLPAVFCDEEQPAVDLRLAGNFFAAGQLVLSFFCALFQNKDARAGDDNMELSRKRPSSPISKGTA